MLPAHRRLVRSLANLGIQFDDEKEDNVVDSSSTSIPISDKTKKYDDVKSDAINDEAIDKESKDVDTVETTSDGLETRDIEAIGKKQSPIASLDNPVTLQPSPINDEPVVFPDSSETLQPPAASLDSWETLQPPVASLDSWETLQPPVASLESPETLQPPVASLDSPETPQPSPIEDEPVCWLDTPEAKYLEGCGRLSSTVEYVIDDIQPGMYLRVVAGFIETPGHFYVIPEQNASILEDLKANLQLNLERWSTEPHPSGRGLLCVPPFGIIAAGLPVGIRRSIDNKWHRGIAIQKFLRSKTVQVYCIDHGDYEVTHVSNLQFLPERFLNALKGQAIRCCAFMGKNYNYRTPTGLPVYFNSGGGWRDTEGDIIRSLVHQKTLGLKFIELKMDLLGPYWLVFIHMMEGSSNKVEMHHVEQKVLAKYRTIYFPHRDDCWDTPKEIEFTQLPTNL